MIGCVGGSIELESREGSGTTFYIKIPLTLAIVSALIVEAAGQKFAIPQIAVSELVLARPEQIEEVGGAHYDGDCFVFDHRTALNPQLEETETRQCFACRAVVTPREQLSPLYVEGKSCPHCAKVAQAA